MTVPGGGEISLPDTFGAGPYTFELTEEDDSVESGDFVQSPDIKTMKLLGQSEYDALTIKDPAVLYLIKE